MDAHTTVYCNTAALEEIASKLSKTQRQSILSARRNWSYEPPRCYGHPPTMRALRERGLAHGDFCYLTPLGLEVRNILLNGEGK